MHKEFSRKVGVKLMTKNISMNRTSQSSELFEPAVAVLTVEGQNAPGAPVITLSQDDQRLLFDGRERSCGILVFCHKHIPKNGEIERPLAELSLNELIDLFGLQVLIVRQKQGHFSFPKGHMELNETEEETALREVKEETRLDVKIIPGWRKISSYHLPNGRMKDVVFYAGRPVSNDGPEDLAKRLQAQTKELLELGFVDIKVCKQQCTFKTDSQMLMEACIFWQENLGAFINN